MVSLSIKLRDPKDMSKSHFQILMPGIRDSKLMLGFFHSGSDFSQSLALTP